MASISSLTGSSSSTSSIYGNRNTNIISGLASGMDTEAMIEGMVQGYKQKILSLQQDRTKLQWQQSAYQSISDKLVELSRKYTSYTSTTNLFSNSFFNNAVITSTTGKYADMVTATGKSSSQISIDGVAQLATAARGTSSADNLSNVVVGSDGKLTISGSSALDLDKDERVSTLAGSLTLTYGTKEVTIEFDELEFFDKNGDGTGTVTAEQLASAIEKKLADQKISTSSGSQVDASDAIKVSVGADGTISFSDKLGGGNTVYISDATGSLKSNLGLADEIKDKASSFQFKEGSYVNVFDKAVYLSDKSISVTLDGVTKTISLADVLKPVKDPDGNVTSVVKDEKTFKNNLNEALDKAFGKDKVSVSFTDDGALSFSVKNGSTLAVSSSVADTLGIKGGLTSYLDTSKRLDEIGTYKENAGTDPATGTLKIGEKEITGTLKKGVGDPIKQEDGTYLDSTGALVDAEGYCLDSDGERICEFKMTVNGTEFTFDQNTAVETIINSINSSDCGASVSYSKLTNQFVFTATETGEGGQIEIGGDLGQALFNHGGNSLKVTAGQDAVFQATINGETRNFTRSSNTFDLDGMSITLNGLFNNKENTGVITSANVPTEGDGNLFVDGESVTFTSKTDTDTVLEAIKQFVEDYNALVTEVKKAYTDQPVKKTDGSRYEPLTSEDEADMTESEIEAYEEKAKTGLLFMDNDLSSLYSSLRSAVVSSGSDAAYLRSIGINTSYEDGLTTITLDETALKEALENDLDGVRNAFTKSKENGAATDGLMASISNVTEKYAATTGAVKGILIEKAGSKYAPTSALDNTLLNKMGDIDEEIEKWQDKMSDKVDYYTNKFTQLEMLINQMNSQSSALSGLTGGY